MNRRDLFLFLFLQMFAVVWAGAVFALIEERRVAGALAGGYFVVSGLVMVVKAWWWGDTWRALCWYPLLAHVFAISLPMVITRFMHVQLAFSEVKIWGLEGPQFHRLSSAVFGALVAATVIDLARVLRKNRTRSASV